VRALTPLLLLICAVPVLLAGDGAMENQVGRYQLFSGPIDLGGSDFGLRTGNALYRIDTATGQTWLYNRWLLKGPKKPDGQFAEAWTPIGEDFQISLYLASMMVGSGGAITNYYSSTNALRDAMTRMYWSPKQREEYEAMEMEVAIQRFNATNITRPAQFQRTNEPPPFAPSPSR